MARCSFCGRTFKSSQSVRAHLKTCPDYLLYKQRQRSPAAPRSQRALTDEQRIQRLVETAPSYSRRPAISVAPEPRAAAPRPTPGPDNTRAQEQRAQEARRQQEAQRESQRQQAAEQRQRAERTRALIQHIKVIVVDCYFPFTPIPMEAIAEVKEEIERKLGTLPILELPVHELQQLGTALRDKIYRTYRTREVPVSPPPYRDVTPTPVHNPVQEVTIMPMHKLLTGDFFCPRCDEEFALDRVPENEALCPNCRVALEEFEADEGDDDGE